MTDDDVDPASIDAMLEDVGFDADQSVLTRRQAEVLALREREFSQREIADALGTSRANVSSIESSARQNVQKARETVAVADALAAPVQVHIDAGTDLFDVPDRVYARCDEAGTKVSQSSAALVREVRSQLPDAVEDHTVLTPIRIAVTANGAIRIERAEA